MIAAGPSVELRRVAELAHEADERFVQEPALLEVFDQAE